MNSKKYSLNYSNSLLIKDNSNNILGKDNKNLSLIKIRQKNNKKEEENEQNFQEVILNKSNKTHLFFIKIYYIILTIFLFTIIVFTYYKIILNIQKDNRTKEFYILFVGVTDRYTFLFYDFNIFRTLLILPEGKIKKQYEEIMEKMEHYYEEENKNFLNIKASKLMNSYFFRTKNFLDILTESKNNSKEKLKSLICEEDISCQKYLDSKYNFFDSGFDFGYKSSLIYISNMYLKYKKLNNNIYDINLINSTIINNENSHFKNIELALDNLFIHTLEKLFYYLKDDINDFLLNKINDVHFLDIISIILAIIAFLLIVGIILISVSKFSERIEESTYRLSYSLYKIKR